MLGTKRPRLFLDGIEIKPKDGRSFVLTFMSDQRRKGILQIEDQEELNVWIIQTMRLNSYGDAQMDYFCYTKKSLMPQDGKKRIL